MLILELMMTIKIKIKKYTKELHLTNLVLTVLSSAILFCQKKYLGVAVQ